MLQVQLAEMGTEGTEDTKDTEDTDKAKKGIKKGHCAQDELVTRLAAAVLAPWQHATPQAPARGETPMEVDGEASTVGKADDPQYDAAARRADIMFDFAWGWIFDKALTSPNDVDVKCAPRAKPSAAVSGVAS